MTAAHLPPITRNLNEIRVRVPPYSATWQRESSGSGSYYYALGKGIRMEVVKLIPLLMSLTLRLADFSPFHNCEEALTQTVLSVTEAVTREGSTVRVPSAVCLAVCLGVGQLPPSRRARSPVTQPSPRWPRARLRARAAFPDPSSLY